jgi:hypothetical protein
LSTLIHGRHAALQTIGRLHRDGPHAVLAQVLLDLDDDVDHVLGAIARLPGDADRVVDVRQMAVRELDVHDRSDDLHDLADSRCRCYCHGRISLSVKIQVFTCKGSVP